MKVKPSWVSITETVLATCYGVSITCWRAAVHIVNQGFRTCI